MPRNLRHLTPDEVLFLPPRGPSSSTNNLIRQRMAFLMMQGANPRDALYQAEVQIGGAAVVCPEGYADGSPDIELWSDVLARSLGAAPLEAPDAH